MSNIFKVCLFTFTTAGLISCASAPDAAPETLYEKLGGEPGVHAIVEGTFVYTLEDDRIKHTFDESNVDRVKMLIEEQICDITDGPCEYTGQTMERVHRGLELTTLHFNALVENMQKAMRDEDIPFRTQNQLIAILAPMHGDVVQK